ncbi:hypothetical protein [Streptomyces mirabilis]|uniref:hypothetical protein n=1 Tax=Streptomyces mirabilis TaxID=68239 RepID=UPI0036DD9863
MESAQRVVHRSGLFSRLLVVLVGMAVLLLGYSLFRENLSARLTRDWPWKLKLLDIQSAVTAVLGTGGAALARAQYARTVRPAIGYGGRVVANTAPNERLAWACKLLNGGHEVAITADTGYWIGYTSARRAAGAVDSSEWMSQPEATAAIVSRGLAERQDFQLNLVGRGYPIPGQGQLFLGWFTEKAMRDLESVYVRVRVVDRVGDVHERVVNLLKGADRSPTHPEASPF